VLSAQVQSYGIALTVTFLALLLAAGATAAERDEGTVGRLRRGLVSFGQLVWSKVALAALVGVALGAGIAVVFGIVVEVGGVTGGEPWARIPLLLVGVALAAAVVGAAGALLGALAREARTASLLAVLIVLPVVFLGLVPREALAFAWWVSEVLPFAHAVRWFGAALYDASPWRTLASRRRGCSGSGCPVEPRQAVDAPAGGVNDCKQNEACWGPVAGDVLFRRCPASPTFVSAASAAAAASAASSARPTLTSTSS